VTRVLTSRYLQTNATVLPLPGGGTLLVDSPYFPDELDALRDVPGPVTLFATHAHYDHVMGRLAHPDAPLRAFPSTAAVLRTEPTRPQDELAAEDARTYVRRERPLHVADAEPVDDLPGVRLVRADGHTGDGCVLLHEATGTLCIADHLSDVELPLISWAGSRSAYAATLDRIEPLLAHARLVVPGHGSPADPDTARRRLQEDRAYLAALEDQDPDQPLPTGRDSDRQREIHRANLVRPA
jgi:glyoxylase-like metal-dependent hydrolase (beta-lactamase superfamily II)